MQFKGTCSYGFFLMDQKNLYSKTKGPVDEIAHRFYEDSLEKNTTIQLDCFEDIGK